MPGISQQHSIQTEGLENKLAGNGSYEKSALTMFEDKIYLGDGRETTLSRRDELINLPAWTQAEAYKASGEIDKLNALDIYGDKYYEMHGDFKKIDDLLVANPGITSLQIAGAAGEEALTHYETIRKSGKLAEQVSGLQRILEKLNAFNIAKKETTDRFKHEYLQKTSAVLTADSELADDVMPGDVRSVFAIGEYEIMADGTSYKTSLRDKELKIDVSAEIAKEIPGMFAQTQENKVIALVNAISGTNIADLTAVTGNFYDTRAAEVMDTAKAAVDSYGGEIGVLMHSDTWRIYMDNIGSAFDGKAGNVGVTNGQSGVLAANPGIKYWINDSLTSQSFVMAALNSYMKHIQGMIIKTSFKDVRTAGQTETTFEFNYNGFFEDVTGASYRGLTVGA